LPACATAVCPAGPLDVDAIDPRPAGGVKRGARRRSCPTVGRRCGQRRCVHRNASSPPTPRADGRAVRPTADPTGSGP